MSNPVNIRVKWTLEHGSIYCLFGLLYHLMEEKQAEAIVEGLKDIDLEGVATKEDIANLKADMLKWIVLLLINRAGCFVCGAGGTVHQINSALLILRQIWLSGKMLSFLSLFSTPPKFLLTTEAQRTPSAGGRLRDSAEFYFSFCPLCRLSDLCGDDFLWLGIRMVTGFCNRIYCGVENELRHSVYRQAPIG